MRIAALIFGLLAGGLGAAAVAYGNLETGLATAALFATGGPLTVKVALYAIIGLSVIGALLALFLPKTAGVLMLLVAAAWVAAAFAAGHGAVFFAALPFTFVASAGLVALFSPRRNDAGRDLVPASPAGRRQWDEDNEDEGPSYAPTPRGLRGRNEPDFNAPARRPVQPPGRPAPFAPPIGEADDDEDYTPAEDYVDAEEAVEEEAPEGEYYDADDEPPEEDDQPSDEGLVDEDAETDTLQGYPSRGREQDEWSQPDSDPAPPPRSRQRNIPERAPAPPSRRQPAARPGRERPVEDSVDVADADFTPQGRDSQARSRNAYGEFEPFDADQRRPRRGALGGFLRLLMLLVVVLVVAGIAAAVYFDYERGPNSIIFGSHGLVASVLKPAASSTSAPPTTTASTATPASKPAPSGTPAPASTAATPTPTPTPVTRAPTATPAATAPAETPATTPAQTSTTSAAATPAANSSGTYADPFAYCHSVETADVPGSIYTGPAVPDVVAAAVGVSSPTDQVHWRCASQDVLACNANHGPACDLTPTVDIMLSYCAAHPDAQAIPAPNGTWSCNGKRPVIPRDQKWPVDARGFYPGAWKVVPNPAG